MKKALSQLIAHVVVALLVFSVSAGLATCAEKFRPVEGVVR